MLLKNKNKTLFIIVDYFNYVFKEDEKAHEIIKKVNDNKDHEKIKLYLSEAHRSNFFKLSKECVRISRKSNIDYIFETQEFENCNDFEIKLVFSSLKKRGFGSAFYNLNVGEFKIIKNKKLIKLSSAPSPKIFGRLSMIVSFLFNSIKLEELSNNDLPSFLNNTAIGFVS